MAEPGDGGPKRYGVSLADVSCRLRWPAPTTLALDNAIGLVGRQLDQFYGNFLIASNVYVDRTCAQSSL